MKNRMIAAMRRYLFLLKRATIMERATFRMPPLSSTVKEPPMSTRRTMMVMTWTLPGDQRTSTGAVSQRQAG